MKPTILTLDDDPQVLRAIQRDMRRQYGREYRIVGADSGESGLVMLDEIKNRNETVALILSDQRMPGIGGVAFLEQSRDYFPEAKRVLLTAYADTNAAIQAINDSILDYYLMKPWNPPEEALYPVVTDLLDDWQATYQPPFQGVRVIGDRWSSHTHGIRDFLSRNQVPHRWLDVEKDDEAQALLAREDVASHELPAVFFTDGSHARKPDNTQIANRIGLQTQATNDYYDLIIIGGGPAGLAAAVYGASEGLRTVVIERHSAGGQAGMSSRIENYLGFPVGLSGADLARRAVTQARRFGAELLTSQEAVDVKVDGDYRIVTLKDGTQLTSQAILLAMGVSYRRLNAPGIERLTGAGVYYGAAITEALSVQGEEVYVVGAGNSAGQGAMYFSKFASHVTILVRDDSLEEKMSSYLIDQIAATPNISVRTRTTVDEVKGDKRLETLVLRDGVTGELTECPATGLFLFIGAVPRTDWIRPVACCDSYGFLLAGGDVMSDPYAAKQWRLKRDPYLLESSAPGVFVAGDVRANSVKRVASSVGEGSLAIHFVHRYLATL